MSAWVALALALSAAEPSLDACDVLRDTGDHTAPACYRRVAEAAPSRSDRAEALRRAGDLAAANAAYREAAAADPADAALRARWGRLFLEAHQSADAEALFQEALALDGNQIDALLGLAELAMDRFEPDAQRRLARVLELDPGQADARLLLARLALQAGDSTSARDRLALLVEERGISQAQRLQGFALLAAADAIDDQLPSLWTERALARNPEFGAVHAEQARMYVINRRYREAVRAYEKATETQPTLWDAHAELGLNLLRVDRIDDARRHLETAYRGDPYNALTVNTLRLLDLLDGFAVVRGPGLLMRAPADQAQVLAPHVVELGRRAAGEMAARYEYEPTQVVVELYEHHDDFAVRTAGLPGLGILGATFGDVVVMDGPGAKSIEEGFDWRSALWHELAHVYTLGATDNRVSRWLSEGISVLEEWQHGPSPQQGVPLSFLEAAAEGRLLPIADLDSGFLRPRYPGQVGVSYVQAGLVCELVAARYPGGLVRMLDAYRDGAATVDVLRTALRVEPADFDRAFRDHLEQRFGKVLDALAEYQRHRQTAEQAVAEERWAAAVEAATAAVALYPQFVAARSPYLDLARGADALGQDALVQETLGDYVRRGGRQPGALKRLAAAYRTSGELHREISVRQLLAATQPLDVALQVELGERLAAAGRHDEAAAALTRALALEPYDRAAVQLQLARSLYRLGRVDPARRTLLQALEAAPNYGPALELLLMMNGEP